MSEPRDIKRLRLERTGADEAARSFPGAEDLNEQQLAAVSAPSGPVLVLAGAGSGKTRVITYRVAYLLSVRRVKPQEILLTTFTNKASRSMLRRVEEVAGPIARNVTGGTFHHIANLLLRRYAKELGYESSFTILDESDARSVMKQARDNAGMDTREKAFPSARLLVNIGSAMINTATDLDTLLINRFPHLMDVRDAIERVLVDYHSRKRQSNQMDFDDLLVNFLTLLTDHPEVRSKLAGRFQHILVDEYQDVNHVQAQIVKELYLGVGDAPGDTAPSSQVDLDALQPPVFDNAPAAGTSVPDSVSRTEVRPTRAEQRGLFVVGDDAQSIYSFRGADYTNIRNFARFFPGAQVFKLETNYRSVPEILTMANHILDEADPEFRKELRAVKPSLNERPTLLGCHDVDEEAEFIAEQVLRLREEIGLDYSQIAVLYRAHAASMRIEMEFNSRGIPYVVRGGLRFYEQAHVKDLLSYLFVIGNRRDELAWQRMLDMCNRVGVKTIGKVLTAVRGASEAEGGALGKFMHNGVADKQSGQAKKSLGELRDFLRALEPKLEAMPVPDLIQHILEERYQGYMELKYENWRQRIEDIEQLIVHSARFDSLHAFLADVGLNGSYSGKEITGPGADVDIEEGAVTLSTIHQAKGLEWRAVFIVQVQDDVIPHRMTRDDPAQEEEEQRLLYVAVTRAEEMLFLSYPQMSQTRDFQRVINRVSRFLSDLPKDAYDEAVLEWN